MIEKIFGLYKENGQIVFVILGVKCKFKSSNINQIEEVCCIQNLSKIREQKTNFPHPIGIVIHPDVKIGYGCTIFQNVTIGQGKYNKKYNTDIPEIGDHVTIYANAVIIGGIRIGKNSIIGAGSIVLNDVPDNTVVGGNPAKIIKHC